VNQYRLCVETVDKIYDRRIETNKFYISLLTALFALLSLVTGGGFVFGNVKNFVIPAVAFVGILLCIIWVLMIRSYKLMNVAKYEVIHQMENDMGLFHCYEEEWANIQRRKRWQRYIPQAWIEYCIPAIFALAYLSLLYIMLSP